MMYIFVFFTMIKLIVVCLNSWHLLYIDIWYFFGIVMTPGLKICLYEPKTLNTGLEAELALCKIAIKLSKEGVSQNTMYWRGLQ